MAKELFRQKGFSTKESLENFKESFKKETGMEFEEFRKNATNVSKFEDEVDLRHNGYILYSDAHDQSWILSKEDNG